MRRAKALLAVLLTAVPGAAHDHWIAPSTFAVEPGARVDLTLCVGHPAGFEAQVRDPRRLVRFEVLEPGASAATPVPGIDGRSPAGLFRPRASGTCVVVFESEPAFVEIDPETYRRYLVEEGLDDVARERAERGELDQPGRDHYVRCDKALVQVGEGSPGPIDRVVGLPLELVLEDASEAVVVRLEREGRPLAGRQVKLMRLAAPFTIALARTDADGRARFAEAGTGPFVASTVDAVRSTAFPGDWDALWASVSFEVQGKGPAHHGR